jgi:hypothetical protein
MKYNTPQVTLAGSSIRAIEGQPSVSNKSLKSSTFADTNPALEHPIQYHLATASAYQADE